MKKTIKVLLFLISIVSIVNADFKLMSFKELTRLASEDLKKNIYLDKDLPKYSVEINLAKHQKIGEVYEFYKVVLFENDLLLQYNKRGDFYFVKLKEKEPIEAIAPVPIHPLSKIHYYTYKIKNITNEDVVDAMTIFSNIKYKYLKQSDMIAYSSTRSDHLQIRKILKRSDNKVLSRTIKITMFSVNKNNLKSIGSQISMFNFEFDSTLSNVLDSLQKGSSDNYSLSTNANISFTLSALQEHKMIDIFQEPTILLTNGIETSVNSVINVPYLKTTSSVDATNTSVTEAYDYKDIGLQIKINPKIKKDWVYLNLNLISDELISLDDNKPITQKVSYKSTIKVRRGKPILLTGIKKTSHHYEKSGVPFLADLPYIGHLFKYSSKKNEEQNINILIEIV